ncbi:hypothetical protein AVEN_182988-2 [Araneus ventricosus]|uniref:Uncharacterized protein n=1 Tax=Araneus ventricosus TaxID=182803 RepID=A0A4Y2RMP4_ARAVE|nr:hypothetical protein AVEN_182988-2 [Araneus ventricosus]
MIPRHASRCHHGPFNSLPMMDLSTLCPQWPARPKTVPDFFGIIVGKPKRRLIERKNKVDGNCIQDHSPPDQRTDIRTNLTSSSIGGLGPTRVVFGDTPLVTFFTRNKSEPELSAS